MVTFLLKRLDQKNIMIRLFQKRWLGISFLLLLPLVIGSAYPHDAVDWGIDKLVLEVAPEGHFSTTATLRANRTLQRVKIRISPHGLGTSATPAHIRRLRRGESAEIEITGTVPSDLAPGETAAGSLRAYVRVFGIFWLPLRRALPVEIISLPDGLPPDPGPDNDLTVEGIDSDGDGIRDDVERAIAFKDLPAPQTNALRQAADSIQRALLVGNDNDEESVPTVLEAHDAASNCLLARFEDPVSELVELENRVTNTEARIAAYEAFRAMSYGRVFGAGSGDPAAACE